MSVKFFNTRHLKVGVGIALVVVVALALIARKTSPEFLPDGLVQSDSSSQNRAAATSAMATQSVTEKSPKSQRAEGKSSNTDHTPQKSPKSEPGEGKSVNIDHLPRVCSTRLPSANNFTLITALFDTGRGRWNNPYRRPFNRYIYNMEQVLQMDAKLVVIGDDDVMAAVKRMRVHCANKTRAYYMRMQDLPLYKQRGRIQEIMKSEEFLKDNVLARDNHPEATIPEYDIVTLSKPYLIDWAIQRNPFNSSFFIWLDGGYGHGEKNVFPKDGVWIPYQLYEHEDKATMIELGQGIEAYRHNNNLHKLNMQVNNGGFIAGGKKVLQKIKAVQEEVVADWLKKGIVDDDQSAYMATYFKDSSLFRFVKGDWHDAFKLFNRPR